jgi:hypothetical protein
LDEKDFGSQPCPDCGYIQSGQLKSHYEKANSLAGMIPLTITFMISMGVLFYLVITDSDKFTGILCLSFIGVPIASFYIFYRISKYKNDKALKNSEIKSQLTISWE